MRIPEPQDRLYDYRRLAAGKRPDGFVYDVDEEEGMYTVVFPTRRIERSTGCSWNQTLRIDGILHHESILLDHPEYLYEGSDEEQYFYGEIYWSSSDGGMDAWVRS
jgi:hypothetical protein